MVKKFDAKSYSAASTFPMKILTNQRLIRSCLRKKRILPIHLQLCPTNKCNFKCSFCSCSSRDRKKELSLETILEFMAEFQSLDGESVTITGGGDPFAHQNIAEIIDGILGLGIKIGIVSNGSLWNNVESSKRFGEITWVRVSSSDWLHPQLEKIGKDLDWWLDELEKMVEKHPRIDYAFSHVVTNTPEFELITDLIRFANKHNFTHIRLVSDILNAEYLEESMQRIKSYVRTYARLDDGFVNYQDRAQFTKGVNPCFISLLKPVVAADGSIYPCCGVQYALETPSRTFEPQMEMGSIDEFRRIIDNQEYFDGSKCVKCYYNQYNSALGVLLNGIKHKEFI